MYILIVLYAVSIYCLLPRYVPQLSNRLLKQSFSLRLDSFHLKLYYATLAKTEAHLIYIS